MLMKHYLIFFSLISQCALAQLPIQWDVTNLDNCDADGVLNILNDGQFLEVGGFEGSQCEPCTVINSNGNCMPSSGMCSALPNYIAATVDVSRFDEYHINVNLMATSPLLDCSSCGTGDQAILEVISTTKGFLYMTSLCGSEPTQSFSTQLQVECEEQLIISLHVKSNQEQETYAVETFINGIGTAPVFTYPNIVSYSQLESACVGDETTLKAVIDNCENCEVIWDDRTHGSNGVVEMVQLDSTTYESYYTFTTPLDAGLWFINLGVSNDTQCYDFEIVYYEVNSTVTIESIDFDPSMYITDTSFVLSILTDEFYVDLTITDLSTMNTLYVPASDSENIEIDLRDIPEFGESIGLKRLEIEYAYFGLCPDTTHIEIMLKECTQNLILNEVFSPAANFHFEAENFIYSTNQLLEGATIILDAGQSIVLDAGFAVEEGALFSAVIDGCDIE